ncbi:MAG TPA: putative baseplate assembly protein [Pyrinomonadaceae bacterium]|nr:putative baseplate assembly protein [Pyrinomonadaceae bacterium]
MSSSVDTKTELNDCGCCEGTSIETPASKVNRPGLSAIAYRVGTHSQFKETLLARLTASGHPALNSLTARDNDDFSIALLDAWATVGDVLSFYQERIANEAYLRTATERLSVLELARLINYQLSPGVAASTYLAFTLEEAPGALGQTLTPGTSAQVSPAQIPPVTIDVGTKVQSVPGPGELAQTFETAEKIEARPEWNALKARLRKLIYPVFGDTAVYLKGVANNLKVGDSLLFVGQERASNRKSDRWDVRPIKAVEVQAADDRTRVVLERSLGDASPRRNPPAQSRVFVFRNRASIFGYNAPDWRSLPDDMKAGLLGLQDKAQLIPADRMEWPDFTIFSPQFPLKEVTPGRIVADLNPGFTNTLAMAVVGPPKTNEVERLPWFKKSDDTIDLDAVYQKITVGSWVLLSLPNDPGAGAGEPKEFQRLYQATRVVQASRADFLLSGKTSRVTLEGIDLNKFEHSVRTTAVLVESEELELAETPLERPVWKERITLDALVEGLLSGKQIIVTGKLLRRLRFKSTPQNPLPSGEFFLLAPPQNSETNLNKQRWPVINQAGSKFFVEAPPEAITFLTSIEEAEKAVSELVVIDSAIAQDEKHTRLVLTTELVNVYDAATVVISANVALSTHGETTNEVLGGGDATKAFQRFVLKQPPLTYVSSSTAGGGQTTLEVRVNDILWREVPDFYGHEPEERIYVTRLGDDGKTTVIFGDGETGARLPTGQENIKAKYRKGIGLGGVLRSDQLTQLMTRPLGVKGVTNPIASSGAADAEVLADARRHAPLTVLTLGRVVSLKDYEDFARGFSGIGKALATWTWFGERRGVFVTVAGSVGAQVTEESPLFKNLIAAMRDAGDQLVSLKVQSFQPRFFRLTATITVEPDFLPDKVKAEVEEKLRSAFSFEARDFGQPVHLSEVISIMQNVTGVVSVDVDQFHRSDKTPGRQPRIAAAVPQPDKGGDVSPAELLLLDTNGLNLEVAK